MVTAREVRRIRKDAATMEAQAYGMFFRAAEMRKIASEHRDVVALLRARVAASRERLLRRASS